MTTMKKSKHCTSGWWVVLLTATLAVGAIADAGVGLFNARLKQIVTSSTLKWSNLKKEAMENYVVGAESQQGIQNLYSLFILEYITILLII